MKKILVIDDDTFMCDLLVNHLKRHGFEAQGTYTGKKGLEVIGNNRFDLVLCDYRLPDIGGLKILQEIKSKKPLLPVVIITAYADINLAVKFIKLGALNYLTKPVQPEEIINLLNRELEVKEGDENISAFRNSFVTGSSPAIQKVMKQVKLVAPTELTVLIEGETGTGKEFIAKTIHYTSNRRNKPFVAVDCGAIPKDLANSELFGHIKGAFTGAISNKTGYFEQAEGGTLFLDEVGNLPHANQVKLLRALQERFISKVGDNKQIKVNVRIITASNENLHELVAQHEFREDLYYRLNGFKIYLPPIRERGDDIMEFVNFFIQKANESFKKNVDNVSEDAKKLIYRYSWSGNIRELKNVINRSVLLSQTNSLTSDLFPEEISAYTALNSSLDKLAGNNITELKEATLMVEKQIIIDTLIKTDYNKTKTAKILNIDRKTLYNKINEFNIKIES